MIKSFLPPFLLSFMIALFVLTLQVFWLYIDEIMGKGVGFLQIIELISYMTITLTQLALPIAVLLASVMVLGNLGERYELSSLKSAGVSLIRIMAPLVILCSGITIFSYLSSNYLIPKANLKFGTRLFDIRKQKPTLAIEPGVFNDDFYGYNIFVGKKHRNNIDIENVIVYDQNKSSDLILVTRASSGKMYTIDRGNRFIMELYDGEQIEEPDPEYKMGGQRTYPLIRNHFKKYTKSFDLDEFKMNSTDENRFKDRERMLTNQQLIEQIDTLKKQIISGQKKVGLGIAQLFDSAFNAKQKARHYIPGDTLDNKSPSLAAVLTDSLKKSILSTDTIKKTIKDTNTAPLIPDVDLKPGVKVNHFYELLDREKQSRFFKETATDGNQVQSEIVNVVYTLQSLERREISHWLFYYQKYTLALSCLIFLFIGGPMGAIVRKGGFGYPLLISIIFFVMYIMMGKLFEKLVETNKLPLELGFWMTSIILGALGLYLTYKASKDQSSNLISKVQDKITMWFETQKNKRIKLHENK